MLVDKAVKRWALAKQRADNTSVVTLMLDPPGPPKTQVGFVYLCSGLKIGRHFKPNFNLLFCFLRFMNLVISKSETYSDDERR